MNDGAHKSSTLFVISLLTTTTTKTFTTKALVHVRFNFNCARLHLWSVDYECRDFGQFYISHFFFQSGILNY